MSGKPPGRRRHRGQRSPAIRICSRNAAARWRIIPKPPLIFPLSGQGDDTFEIVARTAFETYRRSLSEERRLLLDRYKLADVAFKVVGVGSVGTFCAIGLFVSPDGAPLLLQIKEARTSVLAPYTRPSEYANQGKRVVIGQRIIQAQSDLLLGWTEQIRRRSALLRQAIEGSAAGADGGRTGGNQPDRIMRRCAA